jgi:hypothetical protein
LARLLSRAGAGPVLEVCAGGGELAAALRATGLSVVATDAHATPGSPVDLATADEALARYQPAVVLGSFVPDQPAVVLGSFVPADAGVDECVLRAPSVRRYVVLGARVGGVLGSAALWRSPGWAARPAPELTRWMLTRHDVWIGRPKRPILQHGEAWLLSRCACSAKEC